MDDKNDSTYTALVKFDQQEIEEYQKKVERLIVYLEKVRELFKEIAEMQLHP